MFQSPSLRGSGRFAGRRHPDLAVAAGFNPLHCGAVVASCGSPTPHARSSCFNPLHCGAVVASTASTGSTSGNTTFQSPSLRGSGRFARLGSDLSEARVFQSPSLRGSGRFMTTAPTGRNNSPCFNPLHCGAVVASAEARARRDAERRVSIPFIAGQWSLPKCTRRFSDD